VSSLTPQYHKQGVSPDSINTGPWGLSKNTSGYSDTLPNGIGYTRKGYFQGLLSFNSACSRIKERWETDSYLYFEYDKDDGSTDYLKSKCSIRGNDVYRARVWNRHKDLLTFCEVNNGISYIIPGDHGHHCNILKFTLTVDPSGWDRDEFNSFYSSYFYDLFIKRIRNEYPDVVVARSFEVSTKKARGYLHFNVIAVFPDHNFGVYDHISKKRKHHDGTPIKSWRLQYYYEDKAIEDGHPRHSKEFFNDLWDCGHVDVRAVTGPQDLAEYCLKYHIKYFTSPDYAKTQDLTLATLSLYDKRAFSFPKESVIRGTMGFTETIIDYTVGLDQKTVGFPLLDIIMHNSLDCRFVGFELDFFNEDHDGLWCKTVVDPPDTINPLVHYDKFYFNPSVETICTFDSGTRIGKDGCFFRPKKKHIKRRVLVREPVVKFVKKKKIAKDPGDLVIKSCSVDDYRKDYPWL